MRIATSLLTSAIALALAGTAVANNGNGNNGNNGHGNNDRVRVIVMLHPGAAAGGVAAVRAAGGVEVADIFGTDAKVMNVPVQALNGLQNNPNIEYIEEDVQRHMLAAGDTASDGVKYASGQIVPWGIKAVQADQLPSGDALAANRKLCIIDSGYDGGHEDLSHGTNVTGEYDSGTGWWYTDDNHHGTHVAGTIAGLNNAGVGVVGVNPNNKLKLHIVKVFSASGWAYSSSLVTAANKCKAAGANVISMSLGGSTKSKTEERAFASLKTAGILSIAAAGNDGNTTLSYPASYASVWSVAAIDVNNQWADFSQYNSGVDIAAPGVSVLSTVTSHTVTVPSLTIGGTGYSGSSMDGAATTAATGLLADFGLGSTATAGSMTGKVCLIQRGTVDFNTKVSNCKNSGGVGAVVYNNVSGGFGGTLGDGVTSTIPAITISMEDGTAIKASKLGQSTSITFGQSAPIKYEEYNGTSMATPHASAVAALVWSYFAPGSSRVCTGDQIRISLEKSALDLSGTGTSDPVSGSPVTVTYGAGRDNATGYGLIRAKAAYDRIMSLGCGL